MDKKIMAVAVVAVLVVAGVAAFLVMNTASEESVDVDASLAIMGNANKDSKIDSRDITIINDIISEKLSADDYKLADANNDGKVDQDDADLVQKIINHEKGIAINVICTNAGGDSFIEEITYPLSSTVVVGTNLLSTVIQVGAADKVVGYSKTNYGVAHAPIIENAKCLGGSTFDLKTDDAKKAFADLDKEKNIDCVITLPSGSYLKTSESYIRGADIPVLRIDSSDGMDSIGGALTLGFLYGAESEKISYNFAEKSYKVLGEIQDKVKGISDADKRTFMAITMGYYISETKSAYTGVCEYAGGRTVSTLEGDGSEKIIEGQELYLSWHPDHIISFRTLDYSIDYTDITKNVTLTPEQTWEKYAKYFESMGDSYKGMVYINTSMPVVVRMAYIAELFYPDIFADGYADEIHQEFVDEFMDYLGDFDVTKDMTTTITYDDVFKS